MARIVIGGEGGQGVQTIGEILAEAAYRSGLEALYIPNFGVEQRGGVSLAYVQIDSEPIDVPKFRKAQVVAAMSGRAIGRTASYATRDTVFIYEASDGTDSLLPEELSRPMPVPFIQLATERFTPRAFNIIVLGMVAGIVGLVDKEAVRESLEEHLGYKFSQQPELRELNYRALDEGQRLATTL